MKPLIIIDANNLAHRSWHALMNTPTIRFPIISGMLRDILYLNRVFDSSRMVFCFDLGDSRRKEIYPEYKANREEKPAELVKQIDALMLRVLRFIGFENVIARHGYEADDLVAFIAKQCHSTFPVEIISNDSDMYQLLSKNIRIWNPNTKASITTSWLLDNYGLLPREWPTIKALMGCKTDNVEGIEGVGMERAKQYLRNELSKDSKAFKRIQDGQKIILRNQRLVHLPFDLLPNPQVVLSLRDWSRDSKENWDAVCEEFDADIYAGQYPL